MLRDFYYPGDDHPAGIIEDGLDPAVVKAIEQHAAPVGADLRSRKQIEDCGYATAAWLRVLPIGCSVKGGVGIDDDTFDSLYRTVPFDRRSGYRTGDGEIHRHWWIVVGPEWRIFDPTAHQFDDCGVAIERYVIDGESLVERRRR